MVSGLWELRLKGLRAYSILGFKGLRGLSWFRLYRASRVGHAHMGI